MTQREKNIHREKVAAGKADTYWNSRKAGKDFKASKAAERAARAQALEDVALLAGDMTRSAASGTKWAATSIIRGTANVTRRVASALGLTKPRTQLGRTLEREAPKGVRGFIARVRGGEALKVETGRQAQQRFEAAQARRESDFEARHGDFMDRIKPATPTSVWQNAEFGERTGLGRLRNVAPAPAEDIETMTVETPKAAEIIIRGSEDRRERARLRKLDREGKAGDALSKADAAKQQKRTRK